MAWRPQPPDVARLLERAYAFELDTPAWLAALVEAFAETQRAVSFPNGALAVRRGGGWTMAGVHPVAWATAPGAVDAALAAPFIEAVQALAPVGYGHQLARGGDIATVPPLLQAGAFPHAPVDWFGVVARGGDVVFSMFAGLPQHGAPLPPALRSSWSQVSAHLGAVARLRAELGKGTAQPELVVDGASGRVVDARGALRDPGLRDAVLTAARGVDRVRGRRVTDPEEALRAWAVLAAGRYTIADDVQPDGRRYIVVYDNAPLPRVELPGLTPRERHVACAAALGQPNKVIAFELGVGVSTVSTSLTSAMRKLGVRSRVGLVREVRRRVRGDPSGDGGG